MIKKATAATFCAITLTIAPVAFSGTMGDSSASISGVASTADREIARRQEMMNRATQLIEAGDKAVDERDYETAVSQYRGAVDGLPESDVTHSLRSKAMDCFCDATVKLAEQRVAEGRYQDAKNLCQLALQDDYNPKCGAAISLMAKLEDPEYFNQTITPGFVGKVEDVKKLLLEADGFYKTGRYDMAMKRYDQVLGLDPYNVAARKGQERVNKNRSDYGIEGYNEARSRMLWQLDKAWQSPVRKFATKTEDVYGDNKTDIRGTAKIERKLASIIIPKIELRESTVREAIEYLKKKSVELDREEPKGINIVLKLESSGGAFSSVPAPASSEPAIPGLESTPAVPVEAASAAPAINPSDVRITLNLTNVPLGEALRYIATQANLKIKIDPYAIAIVPLSEPTDVLITKEYKVPPGFIGNAPTASASGDALSAGAGDVSKGTTGIGKKALAREYLESQGVTFPPNASANYLASSSRLVVRNTQENLDLIDILVDVSIGTAPNQVEIESKFVEITQNNLKELGFDWLLGAFNLPGNNGVFAGGGSSGFSPAVNNADYPFVAPGASTPVGNTPLTAGNRSGQTAISANAIDALLFGVTGASLKAPAVLGIAGVFTDPQFQLVIRALNQKKGVDLLSAPRVTTKSGQRATIEIIREFRYPTEFDPPEIPQTFGNTGSSVGGSLTGGGSAAVFPVTPTTPTSFETRNTGVTLEVEPTVGPDGSTIDLNLVPQVVEFEGFINYGSPIRTVNPATLGVGGAVAQAAGVSSSVVLTENTINQPIFSTRKVTTSVSIWDGQTVVIGGLMREDVQKVQDKVPLLGDIPLVGRLFRSDVDQHLKRNLMIFVTARLMNPAGEPVLQEDDEEEVVEPLPLPEGVQPPPMPEVPGYSK